MNETETRLPALHGNNPMRFLAALGVQTALETHGQPRRLHWSDDGPCPVAVLTPSIDVDTVAAAGMEAVTELREGPAFDDRVQKQFKLTEDNLREYLIVARAAGGWNALAFSFVRQGSLYDKNDKGVIRSKPTDLLMLAGKEIALDAIRNILSAVNESRLKGVLTNSWLYVDKSAKHTMRWDLRANRKTAHRHKDASDFTKDSLTNLGGEAWALLGLIRYPCFGTKGRAVTAGLRGRGKRADKFSWPVWSTPANARLVSTLVGTPDRSRWMKSQIVDCGQGRGAFGLPHPLDQHPLAAANMAASG